jgi:hypothetical protein
MIENLHKKVMKENFRKKYIKILPIKHKKRNQNKNIQKFLIKNKFYITKNCPKTKFYKAKNTRISLIIFHYKKPKISKNSCKIQIIKQERTRTKTKTLKSQKYTLYITKLTKCTHNTPNYKRSNIWEAKMLTTQEKLLLCVYKICSYKKSILKLIFRTL